MSKRGRGRGRGGPPRDDDGSSQPGGRGRGQRQDEETRQQNVQRSRGGIHQPRPVQETYRPPQSRGQPAPSLGDFRRESGIDRMSRETPIEHAPPPKPTAEPQKPKSSGAEAISKVLGKVQITEKEGQFKMAKRPGYGKNGREIGLIANYLLLKYKDINIYHYDIDIKFLQARRKASEASAKGKSVPKKGTSILSEARTARKAAEANVSHVEHQQNRAPGKARCREIFSQMLESEQLQEYYPVYDGQKNVYTIKPFPIKMKKAFTVTLEEEGKLKEFEIAVQPVEKDNGTNIIYTGDLSALYEGRTTQIPQEVVMVFDTVMNHRNPPLFQCNVGKSFFNLNQDPYRMGEGLEIWFGYNQSIHLTERGPAVILNFSAKAFHKSGSVIDYASEILKQDITRPPRLDPFQINLLKDKLKKVKIQVTHLPYRRKYIVKGISTESAKDLRLNVDGRETTVSRYFQEKYFQLRYPHLPCLHMQSTNKTTYLPFEVCEIMPNQPVLGKLDGKMTSNMIRKTAIPPAERFREIEKKIYDVKKFSGEAMKKFELFMDVRCMELKGRVIPAPALTYRSTGRDFRIDPDSRGTWRMDGKQFLRSVDKCSWALISFGNPRFCSEDNLQRFADTLCRCARGAGFQLEMPKDIRIFDQRTRTFDALKRVKDMGVTFAVVVLSSRDHAHSYEEVKFLADIKLSLITQCMDEGVVVKKSNPQVATNVLLKINSKVGGVNHTVAQRHQIFSQPVIIFGADAAHSPRGDNCPSIAAVVGSLDAFPSQYAVTCRAQKNEDDKKLSQEIIVELKDMVKHILNCFCKNTRGKRPEKVVFFRDGVSEGQFQAVLENEIPEFQRACYEALDGYIPPLTFIVVQKRHQTRFRPQNPRDGIGKMGNVPPGTTVDTDVVHPVFFDFFICSHEGIQGTSKPAHYTVLYDENKFTADELQQLCYHLCHMYVRCNRSISVPAPVMYAHLACARAKKYADLHMRSDSQSVASSGSSGDARLPKEIEDIINDMGSFVPGMFYV